MQLKTIDRFLAKAFVPPFVVTFFIALFVLVMQTLWLYIDDIAGKGVGFLLMTELVAYMSVSMIPMALPLAVLISSVMVLGNLAERYELSSLKSAGISLWRVMRPLMVFSFAVSIFSYFCSNNFIPVSNLKFKSRLHDIKYQKPTLSLDESVFNNDFQGFSIRIADKHPDGQTIREVMVYDNREANQGRMTLVTADSGKMQGTADGKYFIMHLFNGHQYAEPKPVHKKGNRNYPMMRASFKEWVKVFDLYEFELDRTDEALFKSHHTMLSNRQLLVAIDSIDKEIGQRVLRLEESTNRNYYFWNKAYEERIARERLKEIESARLKHKKEPSDTPDIQGAFPAGDTLSPAVAPVEKPGSSRKITAPNPRAIFRRIRPADPSSATGHGQRSPLSTAETDPWPRVITGKLEDYPSLALTFRDDKRPLLMDKTINMVRTLRDQAENSEQSMRRIKESRVKHVFEFYSKFSLAIACFIFLFIGAPMGAIVRKGGFGWPLLISIVFFMVFTVVTIFSKNIAERFVIEAVPAAWMNCMVVFPMGLLLTFFAMRDMGWAQIRELFSWRWRIRRTDA